MKIALAHWKPNSSRRGGDLVVGSFLPYCWYPLEGDAEGEVSCLDRKKERRRVRKLSLEQTMRVKLEGLLSLETPSMRWRCSLTLGGDQALLSLGLLLSQNLGNLQNLKKRRTKIRWKFIEIENYLKRKQPRTGKNARLPDCLGVWVTLT